MTAREAPLSLQELCYAIDGKDWKGSNIRPSGISSVTNVILSGTSWTIARSDGDISGELILPSTTAQDYRLRLGSAAAGFTVDHSGTPPLPGMQPGDIVALVLPWYMNHLWGDYGLGGGMVRHYNAWPEPATSFQHATPTEGAAYLRHLVPLSGSVTLSWSYGPTLVRGDGMILHRCLFGPTRAERYELCKWVSDYRLSFVEVGRNNLVTKSMPVMAVNGNSVLGVDNAIACLAHGTVNAAGLCLPIGTEGVDRIRRRVRC